MALFYNDKLGFFKAQNQWQSCYQCQIVMLHKVTFSGFHCIENFLNKLWLHNTFGLGAKGKKTCPAISSGKSCPVTRSESCLLFVARLNGMLHKILHCMHLAHKAHKCTEMRFNLCRSCYAGPRQSQAEQ